MPWTDTNSLALVRASSQYLDRANGGTYDITTGSFECWFKMTNLPSIAGGNFQIFDDRNATPGGFDIRVSSADNKIHAEVNGGSEIQSSLLSAGVWYHVCFAWNTSGAELILNAVSQGTAGAATLAAGTTTVYFGTNASDQSALLNGLIDEIRIWNKKRSVSDVSGDYLTSLVGTETNLLSYWKLDNALTDSTSGARTLTAVGSPSFNTETPYATSNNTEVVGVPIEVATMIRSLPIVSSEIMGAPIEVVKTGNGWANQSRNSGSWTNQTKS